MSRLVEFDLSAVLPDHAIVRANDLLAMSGAEVCAGHDARSAIDQVRELALGLTVASFV
jgi:hypothetical protein